MNICVFGAASSRIDSSYADKVVEMGECLARQGHNLVFGAGGQGLMGAAAIGFKKGGAKITGVIPEFFKDAQVEPIYEFCDELIFTETMRERKAKMEDRADAFIIVPGGIGTFEEFFEVLTLKQLGRHQKPIVIYSIDGYYESMDAMMLHSINEKFVNEACKTLYATFDELEPMVEYLNNDSSVSYSVKELKD